MPKNENTIVFKNVRLSYPHLFTPHAFEGAEPKYQTTVLLDKDKDAEQIARVKKLIASKLTELKVKKLPDDKICLKDGAEKPDVDGYGEGVMFISAKSKKRIPVVGKDSSTPITEEDNIIYGGCYCDVSMDIWAQNNKFGKRINAGLRAVRFRKDGEPFGSAPVDPEDEFGEPIEDDEDNMM